mgnify:FL=1
MATFSNIGLKLITQGDEAGTWGTSTNTNLDIVDETFQYNFKNFTSDANITITVGNATTGSSGSPSGREQILEFTDTGGVLTAIRNIVLQPSTIKKMWLIKNSTAKSLIIKMSNGDVGITIASGKDALLYSTGSGVMKQSESASPGVVQVTGASNQITASPTSGNVVVGLDNSIYRKVAGGAVTTGTTINNFYATTTYSTYNFKGSMQITANASGNINIQPITTGGATGVGSFYSSGYQVDVSNTFSSFTNDASITSNALATSWTLPLCAPGSNNQIDIWWDINLWRDTSYQSGAGNPYYGEGKLISRSGQNIDNSKIVNFTMGAANSSPWSQFGGLKFTTPSNVSSGHYCVMANTY